MLDGTPWIDQKVAQPLCYKTSKSSAVADSAGVQELAPVAAEASPLLTPCVQVLQNVH